MTAAEQLRVLRQRAGLSQAEVAARSGVRQPVLSLYERGGREPRAGVFRRLVEVMGYEMAFRLVGGPAPMPERLVATVLPDLLRLGDALPSRASGHLKFPRLPAGRRP